MTASTVSADRLTQTADMFIGRLRTLARLLEMAGAQWRERGRDVATLMSARLADDMFPLPRQVTFACHQAKCFAAYVLDGPEARPNPLDPDPNTLAFGDLTPLIEATILRLETARSGDPASLAAEKRVDLRDGLYLEMPGEAYVEDWLIPHFYFHFVTAYDILRHVGVTIGKPDYMAHVGPYLRGRPPAAS